MADPIRAALEQLVETIEGIELEGLPEVDEALAAARTALDNPDESAAPAPPADGEVGELVAWLRNHTYVLNPSAERKARRICVLLERQAAPVPVAADVYFEFAVSDADYCTQAGGIAPTYAQALDEGQRYLTQYQQDGVHTLELRRVEVLPIPQEEP